LAPIFMVSAKMHCSMDSWIRGFKHWDYQWMDKFYFVGFRFSWFQL